MPDETVPVGTAADPAWLRAALDRADAWVAGWPPEVREAMAAAAEEDMDGR